MDRLESCANSLVEVLGQHQPELPNRLESIVAVVERWPRGRGGRQCPDPRRSCEVEYGCRRHIPTERQ